MTKRQFFTLCMFLMIVSALAVPAKRGLWSTITLDDGTEIKVELRGNEFMKFWQSEDGTAYVKNPETGLFKVADMGALREKALKKRTGDGRMKAQTRSTVEKRKINYQGEKKGLIILVEFSDLQFNEEHTPELYDQIVNEEGFNNDMGFKGSVRDYFKDQSYGQFVIDFDVVGPVTLPESYAYYGENDAFGDEYPDRLAEFVEGACTAIDDEVDFSDYDWNGDGEVDQVYLLYAGRGESNGGGSKTIWPHEWALLYAVGKMLTLDGVNINTYACSCELASATRIDGIGTICHEFSHCLGLPDMYDTNYIYYGMDCWDLMDYGNYNGNSFVPAGYTSYERMFCGWAEPITLDEDCKIDSMEALVNGGDSYIIYNDGNENEYYMLENRQQISWDGGLPNSGLLILHVDYDSLAWEENEVNSTSTQRCTIFPADNSYYRNTAGDIYPYQENDSLTSSSKPAATLNNKNVNGSYYMNKDVTDITQNPDGTISFSFYNKNIPITGINNIATDENKKARNRKIYSIDGRYLGNDINALKNGLYIIDGKKIVK